MPDHENRHRSKGDSKPTHVAQQVCPEELIRTNEREDQGDHRENEADDKRAPLDGFDHRRCHQIQIVRMRRHFDSAPVSPLAAGWNSGKVAPEPGLPRNTGASDGTFCPGATSLMVAS